MIAALLAHRIEHFKHHSDLMLARFNLIVILATIFLTDLRGYGQNVINNKAIIMKTNVNQAELKLSVTRSKEKTGSIVLLVQLQNTSSSIISWRAFNDVYELGIEIHDSKGNPVSMTKAGESMIKASPLHYGLIGSLNPGKSRKWSLDLNDYFKLTPGKYILSTTINIISKPIFKISINNCSFELMPTGEIK